MTLFLQPGEGESDERLLARSTAFFVENVVRNPFILGAMPPEAVSVEETKRALTVLVARYRGEVAGLIHRLHGGRLGQPADKADACITIAAVLVLFDDRPFVDVLRETVVEELLTRAPTAMQMLVEVSNATMPLSVARAMRRTLQWTSTQQVIFLLHTRERGVTEKLLPEEGYLTSENLGWLLGMTPGSVATQLSRLTGELRDAAGIDHPDKEN